MLAMWYILGLVQPCMPNRTMRDINMDTRSGIGEIRRYIVHGGRLHGTLMVYICIVN